MISALSDLLEKPNQLDWFGLCKIYFSYNTSVIIQNHEWVFHLPFTKYSNISLEQIASSY